MKKIVALLSFSLALLPGCCCKKPAAKKPTAPRPKPLTSTTTQRPALVKRLSFRDLPELPRV